MTCIESFTAGQWGIFLYTLGVAVFVCPILALFAAGICARYLPGSTKAWARGAMVVGLVLAAFVSIRSADPGTPEKIEHGTVVIRY